MRHPRTWLKEQLGCFGLTFRFQVQAQLVAAIGGLPALLSLPNSLLWVLLLAAAALGVFDLKLLLVVATSPIAVSVIAALLVASGLFYVLLAPERDWPNAAGSHGQKTSDASFDFDPHRRSGAGRKFWRFGKPRRGSGFSQVSSIFTSTGFTNAVDGRYNIMLIRY
jgi:hypothetical protein